jgi:hypothetical protein
LALLAILILSAVPAWATEQVGSVRVATGECLIVRENKTLAAEQDQPVMLKDELKTGAGAQLSVLFKDETTLTLDESSHASIDTYVFDDSNAELLFKFTQGTFRAITGEIVKANPEGFNMKTPLATIGIRGSDVYSIVQPDGEEAGALHLGPSHALEIKTAKQVLRITQSGLRSRISVTGIIFKPTAIPPTMFNSILRLGSAPKAAPKTDSAAPAVTGKSAKETPTKTLMKTPTKELKQTTTTTTPTLKNTNTTTTPTLQTAPTPTVKTAPTATPTVKTAPMTTPTAPVIAPSPTVKPVIIAPTPVVEPKPVIKPRIRQ